MSDPLEVDERDAVEALRRLANLQRLVWGLLREEPDLELAERLCRYGSAGLAVVAASLLTVFGRGAAFAPGNVPVVFTTFSRDADPAECRVERMGNGRYRVVFTNLRGEEFCTVYELLRVESEEKETAKRYYLVYPCPTRGSEGLYRSHDLVDLLRVVRQHRELHEREEEG